MQPKDAPSQPSGFEGIGLAPEILSKLRQFNFHTPTPIQHQAIPAALEGKDLIGIAQTGTGKTFAFGLPMLQRLSKMQGRGLVIVPTRELAQQIEDALLPIASLFRIGIATFVGGASMNMQRRMLRTNPRVLVATPGRLNDHLQQGTITLREVRILVLDEADRMLDMGFKPQIDRILSHVPRERQTLLFSATMPQEILKLATVQMRLPLRIEVAPSGTAPAKVEQELIIVAQQSKGMLLQSLLAEYKGSVLVFSRTKHGAKKIARALSAAGFRAAEIHANRSLSQRREALEGFKRGRYRVLVATDIAARGIDVTDIAAVINYDLPDDPSDYVHRIGRTGRAGREGRAISFATPSQARHIRDIEKLIRAPLRRKVHPTMPALSLEHDQGNAKHHHKQRVRSPSQGPRRGGSGRNFRRRGSRR